MKVLTLVQLHELLNNIEGLIQDHSETLINELALRDELEFEKELKNTFISIVLSIQNKKRHINPDKKKVVRNGVVTGGEPKVSSLDVLMIFFFLENQIFLWTRPIYIFKMQG